MTQSKRGGGGFMQKKFILLSTMLAMVLSLAACGPTAQETDYDGIRNNTGANSGTGMLGNESDFSRYDTNRYGTYGKHTYEERNNRAGIYTNTDLNNTRGQMTPWTFAPDGTYGEVGPGTTGIQYGGYDNRAYNGYRGNADGYMGMVNRNPNLFPNQGFTDADGRDADIIANVASRVKGVDDATVVIMGGTAYVALDIDQNMSREKQMKAHKQVRLHLERKMPRYNINLTSDAQIVSRIRNIGNGITNGRPVNDFRNELNDLGRRMDIR
jgi:YhcN/YlaJ family sporulation lipoprotein